MRLHDKHNYIGLIKISCDSAFSETMSPATHNKKILLRSLNDMINHIDFY